MVNWKLQATKDILYISNNTNVPKSIIKRASSIINAMCPKCSQYHSPNICIGCDDKSLKIYSTDDEKELVFEHIFNKNNTKEYHEKIVAIFILYRNSKKEMSCDASIIKTCEKHPNVIITKEILYENKYTGVNIAKFINSVFDEYYKTDCNNINIIFRD